MRFLHLGDLHIGKRVNDFPMLPDQRRVLEGLIATAREHDVDGLLLAGDLYDKSAPGADAVALVDWFLCAAAQEGLDVFAVAGNHDSPERIAYGASLLAERGVHVSPVYDGTVRGVELEDEFGPLTVWLLPFVRPATVRRFFPEADIEDYTDAVTCALSSCELDATRRNVLVAHQFVTSGGCAPEAGGSELSLGDMDNVDASVFDAFDYVALGHVHRPQRVGRDEVRYSGSILKYSLSEARGQKRATVIELGPKGSVAIEELPIVPPHDLRQIRGPLASLVSPEVANDGDPEDYLHVVLTDEDPQPDAIGRLRAAYPNVMAVEYDNARTRNATDLADLTVREADRDPAELFGEFFLMQNGRELTEDQLAIVKDGLANVVEA